MAENGFNQIFGTFVGAADAMMALEGRRTAQRDSNLRAQVVLQQMDQSERLFPLKMRLLEEQIAVLGQQQFGRMIDYGLKLKMAADLDAADTAAGAYFGDLVGEYSAWRAGGAGVDEAGVPLGDVDAGGGMPYDAGGGGVDDPVSGGGFGDIELPTGEVGGPEAMLLPDIGPDGLVEGQGDGAAENPETSAIVAKEMARRRDGGGMTGIAAREMARRQAAGAAGGSGLMIGISDPIPEPGSVTMLRKIDRAIQMHGGVAAMAKRHPSRLAQLIEMKSALEGDGEAKRWRAMEELRVKADAERRTVAGKIVAAGLPVEAFGDVLGAIQQGLPVDPTALDARIAAMRDEQAEMRKRGSGSFFTLAEATRTRADELRKEFNALAEVKNAKTVGIHLSALEGLVARQEELKRAGRQAHAANDIAAVYNYMKVLDPTSVVREGEYATAQNAGSIPERWRNAYNKAIDGEFLSDSMRAEMIESSKRTRNGHQLAVAEATRLYDAALQSMVSDPGQLNVLRANVFGIAPEKVAAATQAGMSTGQYATVEDVEAAAARGEIKDGDTVTVGGRVGVYRAKK